MIRILILITPFLCLGQSYAPAPGDVGSTAIHRDSSAIIYWANSVSVSRGPLNIANALLGDVTYGVDQDAEGTADGVSVVSLGDGGEAIVTFEYPIIDGPGNDFAIFENGFIDHYMEFAFVEVSSDGVNYFRFDAVSEIPVDVQLSNFNTSNCGYVNNLAGKYRVNYGTPFDLSELTGTPGLDLNNITHIKLIDVVGSIDPNWGTTDSQGNIINDPYPTEFDSGGFDLDGVGVMNSAVLSLKSIVKQDVVIPNPFTNQFKYNYEGEFVVCSASGEIIHRGNGKQLVLTDGWAKGVYYISTKDLSVQTIKLVKL